MSEKKEPGHNSREGRGEGPKETVDGASGLDRLEEFTRKVVRVPKEGVEKKEEEKKKEK